MPEAGHMSPLRLQSTSCWHRASVYDVLTALCLRFGSAPQGDLCVPSSSRKLLTFEKSQLVGVAHSLLLRSVAGYRGSEYACVQAHRHARRRCVIKKKATSACLSVPVAASCTEAQEPKSDLWPAVDTKYKQLMHCKLYVPGLLSGARQGRDVRWRHSRPYLLLGCRGCTSHPDKQVKKGKGMFYIAIRVIKLVTIPNASLCQETPFQIFESLKIGHLRAKIQQIIEIWWPFWIMQINCFPILGFLRTFSMIFWGPHRNSLWWKKWLDCLDYMARYSFIQLSELGHRGENENAQASKR